MAQDSVLQQINQRLDKVDAVVERITRMEGDIHGIKSKLDAQDAKHDEMDKRLRANERELDRDVARKCDVNKVHSRVDKMSGDMDEKYTKLNERLQRWIIITVAGGAGAGVGINQILGFFK